MNDLIMVAFGGGVNSFAMIIGLREHEIRPDVILFADTGGEKPETYEWLNVARTILAEFSFPDLIVVSKDSMYASLEDECLTRKSLPALAYGWRTCSDKWKQEPQRKFMNHWPPAIAHWKAGGVIRRALGIDAGELRRVKESTEPKYVNWFPLVEWGWNRDVCLEKIHGYGLATPPKSACFYCPASKKSEVIALQRDHPELYKRAVAMENNAELTTIKGLGRRWAWKDVDAALVREATLIEEWDCIEQTCMCFDGEE